MHVVIGAGGALGAAIVQNLAQQNKDVRAVVRNVDRARKVLPNSAEIVMADASNPESIKSVLPNPLTVCSDVPSQLIGQRTDSLRHEFHS
jgi:uncharacterized protein YbjT (DUF2867 family)